MKETLQDQRNWNGVFRGKCEDEARKARRIIYAQDTTHREDSTRIANLEERVANGDRLFNDLDRRTVPKSAIPWYVLLGLAVGLFLARQ